MSSVEYLQISLCESQPTTQGACDSGKPSSGYGLYDLDTDGVVFLGVTLLACVFGIMVGEGDMRLEFLAILFLLGVATLGITSVGDKKKRYFGNQNQQD